MVSRAGGVFRTLFVDRGVSGCCCSAGPDPDWAGGCHLFQQCSNLVELSGGSGSRK